VFFDALQTYLGLPTPEDPVELAMRCLVDPPDETLDELYVIHLAVNADTVDGKTIDAQLPEHLRPAFRNAYNKAYLLLRNWRFSMIASLGRAMALPNLFLDEPIGDAHYAYTRCFGPALRRVESRWKETIRFLWHLKKQ
jgi:hypothetical protein